MTPKKCMVIAKWEKRGKSREKNLIFFCLHTFTWEGKEVYIELEIQCSFTELNILQ